MSCIWIMASSVSQAWAYFRGVGSGELYLDNGLICVSGLGILQGDGVCWTVSGQWPHLCLRPGSSSWGLGLMNCIWIMVCSVSQVWAYFRGDWVWWTVSGQWPHLCLRLNCIWTMASSVSKTWADFRGIGSDGLYLDNGFICVSGLGLLQGDWVWWTVSGQWPHLCLRPGPTSGGLGLMKCIWILALCAGISRVTCSFLLTKASDAELWCLLWSAPE